MSTPRLQTAKDTKRGGKASLLSVQGDNNTKFGGGGAWMPAYFQCKKRGERISDGGGTTEDRRFAPFT